MFYGHSSWCIERECHNAVLRTASVMQRQSFFDRVNQSLERDRLAIESALRVQRPHSTSSARPRRSTNLLHLLKDKSMTKSVLNRASQERWKEMDLNRAKIEHKRGQQEERQQKRQQQQEEEALRRQLRRNNQRQRLHQRMLQGLEKQLEHEDRALQRTALLQAAWSERSRKESFLSEEENRKASERLQSLQTWRLQREKLLAERNERSFEQEKERLPHLALHHSGENGAEVLHVGALQLRHDPRVQQHEAEPLQGRPHLHHQRVARVHHGRLLPAAGAGLGRALHQDVPGVQVSVHKVVDEDLEDRQV
ncbi:Trichohyalin-like isoform X2 [Aix galericulata]|nr:Trichohyalin-like isoform X2 [Aix galericulata]